MAFFDSLKNIIKAVQPQQNSSNNNAQGACSFCSNCGMRLESNAKFCSGCGSFVGGVVTNIPNKVTTNELSETYSNGRQQEYVGTVLKCSNCGCNITQTTAICPECGITITGQAAVGSVLSFKDQLMTLESGRKKGFGGILLGTHCPADPVDVQKLTLIRNFPVPNSIDDILEFMMLAVANIDVSLSKKSWTNRTSNNGIETVATIAKAISNAWVSKMQQIYQKAEIILPNDPTFKQIQKIYFSKMKELKIKV